MTRLTARHHALLAAFALAIFLPGRALLPPLDRDEPRYMQAAAQMLQSGNYVDVRFQDQPRYLQPAGIYWLEAAAVAATGTLQHRQVWGWRIPSLIAATASVLFTAAIGETLFGPLCGLFAAVLLALSVLMTAESRMATIDSCLLTAVLAAEAALLRAWRPAHGFGQQARVAAGLAPATDGRVPLWSPLLCWTALGVGLMLKGPVVLIPGFGTPIALAFTERSTRWWRRLRPAWGVPLMLAIVLPWCVAIGLLSHGAFFQRAVGNNFLGKVASGQQAHGLPPGYHLLVFAIAFWPGSVFAAAALPFVWLHRRLPQVRFLLCWIVPHWLVFEAIATKLPHYVLPAYPAIAILTAASFTATPGLLPAGWQLPRSRVGRALLAAYFLAWLLIGCAIAVAGPILLWRLQGTVSVPAIILAALSMPLILAAAWLLLLREPKRALASVGCAALLTYASLFWVVLPGLRVIWLAPRIVAMTEAVQPCPHSVLASASFSEPSLVFLRRNPTRLISASQSADLVVHDRCAMALIGSRDRAAFEHRLAADRAAARQIGRLDGINYSTGRRLDLFLFTGRDGRG